MAAEAFSLIASYCAAAGLQLQQQPSRLLTFLAFIPFSHVWLLLSYSVNDSSNQTSQSKQTGAAVAAGVMSARLCELYKYIQTRWRTDGRSWRIASSSSMNQFQQSKEERARLRDLCCVIVWLLRSTNMAPTVLFYTTSREPLITVALLSFFLSLFSGQGGTSSLRRLLLLRVW